MTELKRGLDHRSNRGVSYVDEVCTVCCAQCNIVVTTSFITSNSHCSNRCLSIWRRLYAAVPSMTCSQKTYMHKCYLERVQENVGEAGNAVRDAFEDTGSNRAIANILKVFTSLWIIAQIYKTYLT